MTYCKGHIEMVHTLKLFSKDKVRVTPLYQGWQKPGVIQKTQPGRVFFFFFFFFFFFVCLFFVFILF
jgi:hypothetical protein